MFRMKSGIFTLRRLNNVLTILVIGLALYLIAAPIIPSLRYRWRASHSDPAPYGNLQPSKNNGAAKPIPADNRIVIPSAFINEPILEGDHLGIIDKGGSWYKPLWTKSPKDIGNTVLLGHRFTYKNPNSGAFYNLDKVNVGDTLAIYWQGEELIYKITEKRVLPPTAVEVEENTHDRRLTIYTCTPLITAKNRLVLTAVPVEDTK